MTISRDLRLSAGTLEKELKKPKGELFKKFQELDKVLLEAKYLVTVGDFVSFSALENNIQPNLMIIDRKVERKEFVFRIPNNYLLLNTINPKGFVTVKAFKAVKESLKLIGTGFRVCLIVCGEEDLLGFPVVLLFPLSTVMLYGQPGEGIVAVKIDNESKNEAKKLLSLFE